MRFYTGSPWRWRGEGMLGVLVSGLLLCSSWLPTAWADKTAADYFVHSLPGAPDGPLLTMHAGHVEVAPKHHGNLFFWHFQNKHLANRQRTVIWLNGGPGCSSLDGAMMEIGPYRVRKGGKLEYNDGSWDEFANVLFVDNPVGTGFSYVDTDSYLHELKEMADQFLVFLEKWFGMFPQYSHDDIYIAGESYAGQHIPYIARAILDRNKNRVEGQWNLRGLLIGNGWTSPTDQYLSYLPYAYKSNLIQADSDQARILERQQAVCVKKLDEGGKDHIDTPECESILQELLRLTQRRQGGTSQCLNMYDVRLWDSYPSCGMNWPPDLEHVAPYLRRPDVIKALHVNPDLKTGWKECNGAVGSAFRAQHSQPAITLLPDLLADLPIVLFSGNKDLICNHLGTEELINNLSWNGGKGMELSPGVWAPRRDWTFEREPAGFYQSARNLTYVVFYNASHMVPFDYPRRTRDMLDRFMGVDIASIGGEPADSRIDGEKGPVTSVGAHPNSTAAEQEAAQRLQQATWRAYYKSGEVALVVVVVAVSIWGWFIWRDRRRRAGYTGLFGGSHSNEGFAGRENARGGLGLENFRHKRRVGDVEAADFDENELDDLGSESESGRGEEGRLRREGEGEAARYSIGGESSGDEEVEKGKGYADGGGK